jgi:hypothetical protein
MKKALHELSDAALAPINERVTEFQKAFHAHMRAHGYERKVSTQSALFNWDYVKGNHRITIDGWHGTGRRGTSRFYGAAKSFHSLYDSKVPGYKAVIDVEILGDSHAELIAAQDKGMKEALEYIYRTIK